MPLNNGIEQIAEDGNFYPNFSAETGFLSNVKTPHLPIPLLPYLLFDDLP